MSHKRYEVTCDLFSLPYDDKYILYAPRLGFLCLANSDLGNLLGGIDDLNVDSLSETQKEVLLFLQSKGVLNGTWEAPVSNELPEQYSPTILTLFPTNQCNLRCTYCYASAGVLSPMTMDWQVATSSVDLIIDNIKKRELDTVSLGFHGGGEPLLPWQFIKQIVTYAEDKCAEEGLHLTVFSATNGLLSERQLEWIIKHFKSLNISFDGLPHVQDYHRPLPDGKGSFEFVDRTMRFLDEHNFRYGVRSTISSYNVDLMEESIDFIGQNYDVKSVHFEPLFYCGRCKTSGTLEPEFDKFSNNFLKCYKKCELYQIAFTYSGCRIESLTNSFCGVTRDNFSVTPDGYITTCYETTTKDDPKSDIFFIGNMCIDNGIYIDEKKRKFLNSLTVENLEYCADCYAKWHCAGECLAKLEHLDYAGARGHDRCKLNRTLVAERLVSLIEGNYYHPSKNTADKQK